ncbi:MAG: phosphatidylglycerol lysyltransferase domain-containing protein [Deltaproteobacteria bacterium]|jgi:hypothetical protein|nr:phosphatidylglycerol lysyltransferase domain-containing protein [Deltaproteobacteria bacterium]
MPFIPLTIEHRPIFRDFEKKFPLLGSDPNFTNMFIWMNYYHFRWAQQADSLCVIASPQGARNFSFAPLGDFTDLKAWDLILDNMEDPYFSRVPDHIAKFIIEKRPNWSVVPDRDNSDYIYLGDKLRTLSGRAMHQKKNHFNYFRQNYNHTTLPITPSLFDELLEVEDKWLTLKLERGGEGSQFTMEKEAIHNILSNFQTLEVKGVAVKVDGRIEAFSIGEMLSEDTAVVHVEKGNPEIRGIYVALCSAFCSLIYPEATYINREQDLGLPGLRRSKESLKPLRLVDKFHIEPIKPSAIG